MLDSVSSPITKRVYNMALNEFMDWFRQAPRPGFTKATVSAWRVSLEERRLGSSSIIIKMSAIRKLAAEAADNGLLAPELAQGISQVKSVKSTGIRVGNTLSQRQAQALLSRYRNSSRPARMRLRRPRRVFRRDEVLSLRSHGMSWRKPAQTLKSAHVHPIGVCPSCSENPPVD